MSNKKNNGNQNNEQPAPVRLPDPPPGMMRVTRTELVWPGKYNEDGTLKEVPRVSLPFQVIETVNESRATREAKKGRSSRRSSMSTKARRATASRRAGRTSSSGATTCW